MFKNIGRLKKLIEIIIIVRVSYECIMGRGLGIDEDNHSYILLSK